MKGVTRATLGLVLVAGAATATEMPEPRLEQLAPDVYAYTAAHDVAGEPLFNVSGIVATAEGVVIFDGMENAAASQRLREAAEGLGRGPLRFLVMGSWAPGDRSAGNEVFGDVPIIAHRDARANLARHWSERPDPPLPTVTFDKRLELHLGGKEIHVLYLGRGHAAGDAVMYLPDDGIVFASELFFNRVFPGLRTGYSLEWIETIDRIKALGAEMVVPGHGELSDAPTLLARLDEFRQSLVDVREAVERASEAGLSMDEAVAQVSLPRYRDWQLYELLLERNVRRIYDELAGRVD